MLEFQFYQKAKMLFGQGSVTKTAELLEYMGAKKPFIVCDKGVVATGIVDRVLSSLKEKKIPYVIFDEVEPNPPIAIIEKGAVLCKKENCDCVIAVGGGSSIDSGKGITLLRFNEPPLLRYIGHPENVKPSPGLIVVPTTSGTGSELSDGMIVSSEDHVKHALLAPNAQSEYVILDPNLLVGMPPQLTAATGLDTLSHVVEAYTTILSNDLTDFFCTKAMETVVKYLPRAIANGNDIEARSNMAVASSVGGWMLGHSHCNAGHSVAHIIGALFDVPHGNGVAAANPYVLEFNALVMPEKIKYVAQLLGAKFTGNETPEEIGAKARDAFIEFRDVKCKLKPVKVFGYDEDKFDEAAEKIVDEIFQLFQPRKMTVADAKEILKKIYA